MKLILIQNKSFHDFSELYSFEDIIEFRSAPEIDPSIKYNNIIENIEFDEITSRIERFDENIDGIVLSNWLTGINEVKNDIFHSAYELATYIRLSNKRIKYLPILILSKIRIEDILRYSISEPHIIRASYGTRIINPEVITWGLSLDDEEDEFGKEEPVINYLDKIFDITPDNIKKQYHSQIGGRIVVTDNATSGHDIANQWGAFRMAQIAGLDMSEFSHPRTLHFKYLLSNIRLDDKLNPSNYKPFHEGDLNILFIDDNFDKGWGECLNGVLKNNIIKKGEVVINSSLRLEENLLKDISNDKYDLIILDYYLKDGEIGINLLKKIKEYNPVVPVIMFTASNKAWNMDELYEAGADGYYVKEHPDTAHDAEFSIKNFENFHKTVESCLEKGTLLRKYWRKINEIENSDFIVNNSGQKNKERINERLTMFLGLLKKAFEQSKFDKDVFFYSEWELAFLTLWSTFNEIQEALYEKAVGFTDPRNSSSLKTKHPNDTPIVSEWRVKGQNDKFLWREAEYDKSNRLIVSNQKYKYICYSNLAYINKKFSMSGNLNDKDNYELKLFFQIAFLIKKQKKIQETIQIKCEFFLKEQNPNLDESILRNLLFSKFRTEESKILASLTYLNEKRNHLYLTHGEDDVNANFSKLYREQRTLDSNFSETNKKWQEDIDQLFEIVYFLCTGEEVDWNN